MKKILGVLAFSLALLGSSGVSAQIYIAFAGVEGESRVPDMTGAMRIDGVSMGASSTTSYTLGGLTSGKTLFTGLSFSKTRGAASPALSRAAFSGKHFPTAELRFIKPGTTNAYLLITLEEVFVTSWDIKAEAGAIATENIKLTFARFRMEDVTVAPDGVIKKVPSGWDISKNVAY